jgi:UDP-glucose 4-epimerase
MSHVLVTGAGGFLGRRLVLTLLQAGHSVVAAGRDLQRLTYSGAHAVALDVTEPAAFSRLPTGIDSIVHAAVERPKQQSGWAGLATALRVNTLGTLNVLEYAQAHRINKVMYCSTLVVYALPQPLPICENGPTYPVRGEDSYYGISKLAGELICARSSQEGRVNSLCLRLGRIYGPGEAAGSLLKLWAQQVCLGEELVVYGDGERSLDFIYVDDAARAISMALETDWAGGTVNVSSGVETTWRNLAETIGEVFSPPGRPAVIRYVAQGDRTRCYLDIAKAEQLLGFAPQFSLREGLQAWKSYEGARLLTPVGQGARGND